MRMKEMNIAACFLIGLVLLLTAFYLLATETYFLHNATELDAPIVDVLYEYVPKGRGSVLAYVPVVEVPSSGERISVDTHDEERSFPVGSKMKVLCDLSNSKRCIRDTFFDKWGGSTLDFIGSLLFLVPTALYLRKLKRKRNAQAPLIVG